LVLNARVWIRGTLLDVSLEDWDRLMAVNLRSSVIGLKAVLPGMITAGRGSVVAIGSSIGGEVGTADGAAYQASKAGLTALMRSVAAAHGADGVRANAVHSGPMRTETLVQAGFAERMEEIASKFPLPRAADPDEVAAVAAFLASDEASYVTASQVVPDGGSSSILLA
jgi:NAD(P)-dependent dehydrogenase (short-subunit alcohol dehydrogenase family)